MKFEITEHDIKSAIKTSKMISNIMLAVKLKINLNHTRKKLNKQKSIAE